MNDEAFYRLTELDRANWAELRDRVTQVDTGGEVGTPRRYPGYPTWPLNRVGARFWPALDRVLQKRRSHNRLGVAMPSRRTLSRLLQYGHGVQDAHGRGAAPSAGGLQCTELYLACFQASWLPIGLYHYDRSDHQLAQVSPQAERDDWRGLVPTMALVDGGAMLWIVVGDGERVAKKYGPRGYRFLLLEAGHLMQNLCLLSTSLGWCTVPLGGFFEQDIARQLVLPKTDLVTYVGVAGGLGK